MTIDQRTEFAIADLPLDLLVQLNDPSRSEHRTQGLRTTDSLRWGWGLVAGIGLLTSGGLSAALGWHGPSTDLFRYVTLVPGAALIGAYIAWRGRVDYRLAGPERLVLGTTSLVIVREQTVEVLPAEKLEETSTGITYNGDGIDDGAQSKQWLTELNKAIARAKASPAARASDRWRSLSSLIASGAAPSRARNAPLLGIGSAIGGLLALAVAAGPSGTRTESEVLAARARWAETDTAWKATRGAYSDIFVRNEAALSRAENERLEGERNAKAAALATAMKGTRDEIVTYLSLEPDVPESDRAALVGRIQTLHQASLETADIRSLAKILADCAVYRLSAELSEAARKRYDTLAKAALAADDLDALRAVIDAAVDEDHVGRARTRYQEKARSKASTASTEERLELLADPYAAAPETRAHICSLVFPPKESVKCGIVLRRICEDQDHTLYYSGGVNQKIIALAQAFEKDLRSEMRDVYSVSMPFSIQATYDVSPDLDITVVRETGDEVYVEYELAGTHSGCAITWKRGGAP